MSTFEKRLKAIKEHPNAVTFAELDAVLRGQGWERHKPNSGSHYTYSKKGVFGIITVPFRKPHVKRHYVEMVIALLMCE